MKAIHLYEMDCFVLLLLIRFWLKPMECLIFFVNGLKPVTIEYNIEAFSNKDKNTILCIVIIHEKNLSH